jgi:cytochrome c556
MMRIIAVLSVGVVVAAGAAVAQAPESQPVGTMREFMTSVVYPPTNELLLSMNRGAPASDTEWAAVQRSAIQLAESGNVMMMRGRAMDQGMWLKEARALVDVGAAAYKAARAKDAAGLRALETPLNASCVNCHKQYRPNVHPQPQ